MKKSKELKLSNAVHHYAEVNKKTIEEAYHSLSDLTITPNPEDILHFAEEGMIYAKNIENRPLFLQLVLNKSEALNIMGRFEDMIALNEPIIKTFTHQDSEKLKYKIYIQYAKCLSILGDTKFVFEVFDYIQATFDETKVDQEDCGEFYNLKGLAYLSNGYLNLSFENHIKALQIRESVDDYIHQIQSHLNISEIYTKLRNKEKAEFHLKAALDISKKIENNPILIYMSFITNSISFKDYEEVEKWLKLAKPIGQKINHRLMMASLHSFEALVMANIGDKQAALQFYEQLESSILETKHYSIIFEYYREYGDLLFKMNQEKKAITYYKLAKKEIKKYKEYALLQDIYLKLSKAHEAIGKRKKALKFYKKHSEEFNKSLEDNQANAMAEMQIKFETSQKEKEAEKFKTESLKFQLQSLRAQMNPHFVFNAISSISNDMEAATIEKSRKLMESFARLMRSNLEFAEQDKISLEEEITFLNDYLILEQNRLGHKLQFEINYPDDLAIDFIEIPSMLIQPYIENAIKHGILPLKEKGLIQVEFKEKNDFLICTVKDNGVGRKQASKKRDKLEKHLGKSTSITATRLALLSDEDQEKVKVVYEDLADNKGVALGTKVTLKISLN